jgi:hypothetical protein
MIIIDIDFAISKTDTGTGHVYNLAHACFELDFFQQEKSERGCRRRRDSEPRPDKILRIRPAEGRRNEHLLSIPNVR